MNKLSIKQNGFRDCAGACLLSLIRFYGGNMTIEEINYIIKTDEHGTNAFNLIEGAKEIGFDGYGVKKTYEELLEGCELPAIAHANVSNMYHYIVIYEINKKYIKIMDPQYGIKKVSHDYFKKIYLNTIIYLYPVKRIPCIQSKNSFLSSIFISILLNKKNLSLAVILSLVVTILSIVSNLYLKVYIDYIYPNFKISSLVLITVVFIVVIFLKSIFDNIRNKILINIKTIISKNVTNKAFNHIMYLPYHYIKNKPTGEISSRITNLENFKDLLSTIMLNIFVNIFLVIISMIILIVINKTLFVFSLIIILLYFIVVLVYSFIFKPKINNIHIEEGKYYTNLIETLNGYETIKNLNLLNYFIDKVNNSYTSYLYKIKTFERSFTNEKTLKDTINDLGLLFICIICIVFIKNSYMTIGDMIMFTSLILFFTEPIKELLSLVPNIRFAADSYRRINDLLMIEKEKTNSENKKRINGNIKISNLSYSYNNINEVFSNINLEIKKGEKILLYGKSGNGKSTFAKILLKYFEGYQGEILINNINLKDISNDIIRNTISYISQNEVLLSDTIRNNIVLNRNISEEEYNQIIKICKVDRIINGKALRNNFLLEENGFNLSGGERQKVILARGLLKKFNILIMDESLSEIGFEEEIEIIKEIFNKYHDKTIIYISHKKEIIDFFENKYCLSKKGGKDAY